MLSMSLQVVTEVYNIMYIPLSSFC